LVYLFEFRTTSSDGTRRVVEIARHRAKSVSLAEERVKTIMKNVRFPDGIADYCLIKDQMGHVLSEVRDRA
jgi:hypothetical protein